MLATLTSEGAGIRRIELASPRYLDLDDRGGYLGHLELASAPEGGLLVRAVGAGTPAAIAGVDKGDRILQAGVGELADVLDPRAFRAIVQSSKPGD
jgi:S1-C subfamily serine protease